MNTRLRITAFLAVLTLATTPRLARYPLSPRNRRGGSTGPDSRAAPRFGHWSPMFRRARRSLLASISTPPPTSGAPRSPAIARCVTTVKMQGIHMSGTPPPFRPSSPCDREGRGYEAYCK